MRACIFKNVSAYLHSIPIHLISLCFQIINMSKNIYLNPKKLLNSKWTAVTPSNKEKHFMVTKLVSPEQPEMSITQIELEALYSKRVQILSWIELTDKAIWLQGWL